jgi:hypothetical protein
MRITESQISSLTKYAARYIKSDGDLFAEDVVQDAIIKFLEAGKEYDEAGLRKLIGSIIMERNGNKVESMAGSRRSFGRETERFCKCCKEVLPIQLFYILTYKKTGLQIIPNFCKKCTNKKQAAIAKKKMQSDPAARAKYNERMRKYAAKISDKRRQYRIENKERISEQRKEKYQSKKQNIFADSQKAA